MLNTTTMSYVSYILIKLGEIQENFLKESCHSSANHGGAGVVWRVKGLMHVGRLAQEAWHMVSAQH